MLTMAMKKFNPEDSGQTLALREFLTGSFDEMGIVSYYYEAPKDAKFPYAIYDLDHIEAFDDSAGSRSYVMEVNAYNRFGDAVLDNLLDHIEKELAGNYSNDQFSLAIALGFGRIDVYEPAPLKRKRVLFNLKYWYKE